MFEKRLKAFSLIELMFTLAILSILSLLALPKYQHYLKRAHYFELVQAAYPLRLSVELCYQSLGSLAYCDGGKFGIPNNQTEVSDRVRSIEVLGGQIVIRPQLKYGFQAEDDYRLMAEDLGSGRLHWHASGGGVRKGYASK